MQISVYLLNTDSLLLDCNKPEITQEVHSVLYLMNYEVK